MHRRAVMLVAVAAVFATVAAADSVKGSIIYKGKTGEHRATIAHVFYVTGPDSFDPKKTGRLLIFSAQDLGEKIRACATMSCADRLLTEGFTIGFDTAPFLQFWATLANGKVQTSGPADVKAFTRTTDTPDRVAGTIRFNSFGAAVDVEFDATRVKAFSK